MDCSVTGGEHDYSADLQHYRKTGETRLACECGALPSKEWLDNYDPTPTERAPRDSSLTRSKEWWLAQAATEEGATIGAGSLVMRAVQDDEPVMIAWNVYAATPDFANSKKWAVNPEHVDGSLWAAFVAGFNASHAEAPTADKPQSEVGV